MSTDGRIPVQQIDSGSATDGQVPTVQPDGTIAWETPATGGVPAGGSAGQVLTKNSGTDYDAGWAPLGAGSFIGYIPMVAAPGFLSNPGGTFAPTGQAKGLPMTLPGPMRIRGLVIEVTTGATGTVQWGLFNADSDATSATKVAGGSGAASSAGAILIPAASPPVIVGAGGYMLVVAFPSTNCPTLAFRTTGVTPPWNRVWSSYTWDDTPDFTSASWSASTGLMNAYLKGDLNAAGAAWW